MKYVFRETPRICCALHIPIDNLSKYTLKNTQILYKPIHLNISLPNALTKVKQVRALGIVNKKSIHICLFISSSIANIGLVWKKVWFEYSYIVWFFPRDCILNFFNVLLCINILFLFLVYFRNKQQLNTYNNLITSCQIEHFLRTIKIKVWYI